MGPYSRAMKRCCAVLTVLVLVLNMGCARTTPLPGLMINEDGEVVRRQPTEFRLAAEQALADNLTELLGEGWQAGVGISPDPVEDFDHDDSRHWVWSDPQVTVKLIGPADAEPPVSTQAMAELVGRRLAPHLPRPEALSVQFVR